MPRKGQRLKRLRPGQLIGSTTANALIDTVNALLNSKITRGDRDDILIGDLAIVFALKRSEASAGGGNSSYRGEYSPDGITPLNPGDFMPGDIVRVSPSNTDSVPQGGTIIPGVYVCILEGATITDLPNHPLSTGGETAFWQWLSTWPSAGTTCNGDGTTTDVFVDEQPKDPP